MPRLTGPQAKQFDVALRSAFDSRALLWRMLRQELEVNLNNIVGNGGLEEVVPELIDWAETNDRIDDLLQGALLHNPTNSLLKQFGASFRTTLDTARPAAGEGRGDRITGSQAHEIFNRGLFDLHAYDQEFGRALTPRPGAASSRRLLGFATESMEGDFLASLSQRLKRRLGPKPTKDKEVPPLGWQGFDAARLADRLASLSEDVRRNNVLCIVRLGGASSDDLTDFWRRVSETYAGELANYLALIISGPVGTAFPPGILPLPMPQFEYWHFREWALQVVEHFQWDDQDLPERWGMRMYEESLEATEVWKTYQILDTPHSPHQFPIVCISSCP